MADSLSTLLRLRRLAVDQARRGLAESLRAEATAADVMREIETLIDRETDRVCSSNGDDRMVEEYAAWLRHVRVEQQTAAQALLNAETRTQEARAVLAAGRAAVEMVEILMSRRQAEQVAAENRQEQKALDEAGRKLPSP